MPDTAEAVAQYGSAVYRLAYAMTRSRSDADDVFQEVFLRLHRSAPDFANEEHRRACLLYTSPSPRDTERSRMPSSA